MSNAEVAAVVCRASEQDRAVGDRGGASSEQEA